MEDVASLSHVTLRYESGAQALEDVSLVVRPGERVCVLGSNGSGKSTLASVLCGLLAPDSGTVTLLGERVFDSERTEPIDFAAYQRARRSLGLVFQNPDDQIVTTVVEDDVAFGPENLGVAPDEITVRVERELRRVAMTDYAKADPTKLSGGQKQRIAIAGALAMEPQVIVFDEPGSLLDVRGRRAIMRVMGRLASDGATIVHITHFMEEALEADRVVVLERGRIVLEGSPQEVFCHADKIVQLGLEEPFVARLARRLDLLWTCDKDALAQTIAARLGPKGSTPFGPEPKGSTPFGPGSPVAKGALPDATALPVIDVSHVSFSYRSDRKALNDVCFAVTAGSSVAIVGQTGSGKSTLLRLLCALEVPDAGELQVNGVSTRRKRDRRKLHGTIGYVMQHPERQLFAETVMQDVAFGPTNMGLSAEEVAR
jgi:energy-coupling factor transport system ATP-binding protein